MIVEIFAAVFKLNINAFVEKEIFIIALDSVSIDDGRDWTAALRVVAQRR